jgi:Mlc titration factor MtfA (ptsG expression regulator)
MNIPWFHTRRQKIAEEPFPDKWRQYLTSHVWHYQKLTPEEQTKLESDLKIFMAEKTWEGTVGFELYDEVKVVVSALACLLILGIKDANYFPNVDTIIVYPGAYNASGKRYREGGIVDESKEGRLGEAYDNGPVIISWGDTLDGAENHQDANNVVLHEFAHKLDFRNGSADGVPVLHTQEECDKWAEVMSSEYAELVYDTQHNRHTLLREYGATNPAEFFAVATEAFFEKSERMKREHPKLYDVMLMFYGIDWAARM